MNPAQRYFLKPAAAYVLGELPEAKKIFSGPVMEMSEEDLIAVFEFGKMNGLKLHPFKRTMGLPRVSKVLGILKGIQPKNLLDIGTGRGVFLYPLLDIFPELELTCTDILGHRIEALESLQRGGLWNLYPHLMDVRELAFEADSFEVVTALEVLEHIENVEIAVKEICRVAKSHIIVSFPSKEDDNPEHIHVLNPDRLTKLFQENGFGSFKVDYVHNHVVGLAMRKELANF